MIGANLTVTNYPGVFVCVSEVSTVQLHSPKNARDWKPALPGLFGTKKYCAKHNKTESTNRVLLFFDRKTNNDHIELLRQLRCHCHQQQQCHKMGKLLCHHLCNYQDWTHSKVKLAHLKTATQMKQAKHKKSSNSMPNLHYMNKATQMKTVTQTKADSIH